MPKRYVDLDEALELFNADMNFYNQNGEVIGKLAHISAFQKMAREKLSSLPLADVVERKMGTWINDDGLYRCSSCGKLWAHWWANAMPPERLYKEMKYCPRCGAEMREEQQDG